MKINTYAILQTELEGLHILSTNVLKSPFYNVSGICYAL